MGMQGRDDMGTRGDRNITQGTGPSADTRAPANAQQNGMGRTVTQPGGWYERGRDDLRRRAENRFDRNYNAGYSASGANGGNYAPGYGYPGTQSPDRTPDLRDQSAQTFRGTEYDSYAQSSNPRDDQRFGGNYGATQGGTYDAGGMQSQDQRGYFDSRSHQGRPHTDDRWSSHARPRTSHDRDAQAYGDFGHPGGDRAAYGDMGLAERRAAHHTGLGLGDRMRRWRRGASCARDVMTRSPKTVRVSDSLQQVAQVMIDEDTGIVPVIDDENRLVGVITDRDVVCRLVARGVDLRAAKAADAMTDDVECVTEQHSLHDVLDIMSDKQVRRVPVVAKGDRLVGIISMSDIAREADVDEDLQDTFEDISSRRGFWARLR